MTVADLASQVRLQAHLTGRQFQIRYRRSALGWLWAFIQPLSRLAILSFVFTQVIPLGIDNYAGFLFSGIIAWSWFSNGVVSATASPQQMRHLLYEPRVNRLTIPLVSAASDALDFVAALPLLWVFTMATAEGPGLAVLFVPLIMIVQFMLVAGLGALLSTAHVFTRDVQRVVEVVLSLGFYVTPVFYSPEQIPAGLRWVVDVNPMAYIIQAYRTVFLDGRVPDIARFGLVALGCVGIAAVGFYVFHRSSRWFADEL